MFYYLTQTFSNPFYVMKSLIIFYILCGPFAIILWFNATVLAYWKHFLSLFLEFIVWFLFFSHLRESRHDPPQFTLFYDIYSAIDQYYQEQIRCRLFLLLNFFWYFYKRESKRSSMISFVSLPSIISMLLLFHAEYVFR